MKKDLVHDKGEDFYSRKANHRRLQTGVQEIEGQACGEGCVSRSLALT